MAFAVSFPSSSSLFYQQLSVPALILEILEILRCFATNFAHHGLDVVTVELSSRQCCLRPARLAGTLDQYFQS
jgi:hypothetical protein